MSAEHRIGRPAKSGRLLVLGGPSDQRSTRYSQGVNVATLTLKCQDFSRLGTRMFRRRCVLLTVHASATSGCSVRSFSRSMRVVFTTG
jgi:hypothetical protein